MLALGLSIGLDFDNTIVSYDRAIEVLADRMLELPDELPRNKTSLRDYLRAAGREEDWTNFQGALYGPGMAYAEPFEGAVETLQILQAEGHRLSIVSHKSRRPYAGPPYNLHKAAKSWIATHLQSKGLFVDKGKDSPTRTISFLETLEKKLDFIAQIECDVFVDDLPEVLGSTRFPKRTIGILFNEGNDKVESCSTLTIKKWEELPHRLARIF